jgi:hypothetical protein
MKSNIEREFEQITSHVRKVEDKIGELYKKYHNIESGEFSQNPMTLPSFGEVKEYQNAISPNRKDNKNSSIGTGSVTPNQGGHTEYQNKNNSRSPTNRAGATGAASDSPLESTGGRRTPGRGGLSS